MTSTKLRVHDYREFNPKAQDEVRHRALARLYERRSAVDHLIGALERYQEDHRGLPAGRVVATAGERLS